MCYTFYLLMTPAFKTRSSLSLLSEHLRVDPGVARGHGFRSEILKILQLVAGCRERIFSVTKEEKTCYCGLCNFFFWSSWGLGNQGSDALRGAACNWCVDEEIRKKLEHKQLRKRASHKDEAISGFLSEERRQGNCCRLAGKRKKSRSRGEKDDNMY